MLLDYQNTFVELALECQALKFGDFTLKSGRKSPYFFNAGAFHTGQTLAKLGECFAATLRQHQAQFDLLFGPAYKGIPLATATSIALSNFDQNMPVCFNRKEAKEHGEGGLLMGAPLAGKVLIIDDVITAGTAKKEAIDLIQTHRAQVSGIIIALDRQERGAGNRSSVDEIQDTFQIPVYSILTLADLITYLDGRPEWKKIYHAIQAYRDKFGT